MSEFIRPAQDSQFRLLPCDCGSDDVVYQCTARIGWDGVPGEMLELRAEDALAFEPA